MFLLVKYTDGTNFRDTNPFTLARELDRLLIGTVTANPIRSGALLIRTKNKTSAKTLTERTELLGKNVIVEVADRLNSVEAVAHAPSLKNITDQDLITELGPQGVIGLRRLGSRDGRRSAQLCFRFRGLTYPAYLTAGYERLPMRPWVRAPMMCRRCASFGHTQQRCRSEQLCCLRCAGPHDTDNCEENRLFCPHCGGPHAAWDRSCGVLQYRLRQAEVEQRASTGPSPEPLLSGGQDTSERPTMKSVGCQTSTTNKMAEASTQTKNATKKDVANTTKPETSTKSTDYKRPNIKTTAAQTDDLPIFDGMVTIIQPLDDPKDQPAPPKTSQASQEQSAGSRPDRRWDHRDRDRRDADLPPAAGTRSNYKEKRFSKEDWWTAPAGPRPTPEQQTEDRPPPLPVRPTRKSTWWDE